MQPRPIKRTYGLSRVPQVHSALRGAYERETGQFKQLKEAIKERESLLLSELSSKRNSSVMDSTDENSELLENAEPRAHMEKRARPTTIRRALAADAYSGPVFPETPVKESKPRRVPLRDVTNAPELAEQSTKPFDLFDFAFPAESKTREKQVLQVHDKSQAGQKQHVQSGRAQLMACSSLDGVAVSPLDRVAASPSGVAIYPSDLPKGRIWCRRLDEPLPLCDLDDHFPDGRS